MKIKVQGLVFMTTWLTLLHMYESVTGNLVCQQVRSGPSRGFKAGTPTPGHTAPLPSAQGTDLNGSHDSVSKDRELSGNGSHSLLKLGHVGRSGQHTREVVASCTQNRCRWSLHPGDRQPDQCLGRSVTLGGTESPPFLLSEAAAVGKGGVLRAQFQCQPPPMPPPMNQLQEPT